MKDLGRSLGDMRVSVCVSGEHKAFEASVYWFKAHASEEFIMCL